MQGESRTRRFIKRGKKRGGGSLRRVIGICAGGKLSFKRMWGKVSWQSRQWGHER